MRHVHQMSFISTVALLLLIPGYPRAQAPALNREVPPVLPIKQVAYIKASNAEAYDHFACGGGNQGHTGTSIAISGDANTMAVGAPFESGGSPGVNGNQADNSAYAAGAVYVYARQGDAWTQQAYVKASNTDAYDSFGFAVALNADGTTLAVSTTREDSAARGVNGNGASSSLPRHSTQPSSPTPPTIPTTKLKLSIRNAGRNRNSAAVRVASVMPKPFRRSSFAYEM